jgi:hypothetical protein
MHAKRGGLHIARMTQPRFFTFAGPTHTSRTCRLARRSPLPVPSHHKRTRADTHDATSPTQHNGTSASWHVSPKTVHANEPRTPHRTLQPSTQTHTRKSRTPARQPALPRRLRSAHCSNSTARTLSHACHTQRGTQLRAPHTPPTESHTQSHTRPPRHTYSSRVWLPSVDGMLPESWLLPKNNSLQNTRTATITHHIRAPGGDADHSQPPATHLVIDYIE